jgi:hypothetical protein
VFHVPCSRSVHSRILSPQYMATYPTRSFHTITSYTLVIAKCQKSHCPNGVLVTEFNEIHLINNICHVTWVPLTTAWRVLRLRMEERPPIWRVAANIWNKQFRTADKGWSSSLGGWERCRQLLIVKTGFVTKHEHLPRAWTDTAVRPEQGKREEGSSGSGMWGCGLDRAGSG